MRHAVAKESKYSPEKVAVVCPSSKDLSTAAELCLKVKNYEEENHCSPIGSMHPHTHCLSQGYVPLGLQCGSSQLASKVSPKTLPVESVL